MLSSVNPGCRCVQEEPSVQVGKSLIFLLFLSVRCKKINSEFMVCLPGDGICVETPYSVSFSSLFIQDAIRMMITQANNHLEDLQKSLALAGS